MIDLSHRLRLLQADVDRLAGELASTRARVDGAAAAYAARRAYAPQGAETGAARTAWALALHEWATALHDHAAAVDVLRAERREVDQAAEDTMLTPTRRPS